MSYFYLDAVVCICACLQVPPEADKEQQKISLNICLSVYSWFRSETRYPYMSIHMEQF